MFNRSMISILVVLFSLAVVFGSPFAISGGKNKVFDDSYKANTKYPKWFKNSFLDLRDDLKDAKDAGKIGLMVFISAKSCSYCEEFVNNSLKDKMIVKKLRKNFDVIGMEIFNDNQLTDFQGKQMTVKDYVYRVKARFTPTIIFYVAEGKQALKIVGYYSPERFRMALAYVVEGKYKSVNYRDYMRKSTARHSKSILTKSKFDFFGKPPYILDRRMGSSQKPTVVIFHRNKCSQCDRFYQNVLSDTTVQNWISKFESILLDADDKKTKIILANGKLSTPYNWYKKLGLSNPVATVFFDKAGNEVMRVDSEILKYRMAGILEYVYRKGYLIDKQFQRWRAIEARKKQVKTK